MSGLEHGGKRHRVLLAMICCESVAFVCTLVGALLADSLTLWANCLRVGLDLPASFFALYVSGRILRGSCGSFDYGLGKWENLASLVNVPMMFVGLAFLAFGAVQSFLNPRPVTDIDFGLAVIVVFAVVNIVLMLRFHRLNRDVPAPLVYAQYILYRNATVASVFSILALLGARLAGSMGVYFDIIGAVVLAILIVQSAVLLMRQSLSALLDETVEESLQMHILGGLAGTFPDYLQLHRIRSRHSGDRIFIELFLEFDPEISVREMTARSKRIQQEIVKVVPGAEAWVIPCESAVETSTRANPLKE